MIKNTFDYECGKINWQSYFVPAHDVNNFIGAIFDDSLVIARNIFLRKHSICATHGIVRSNIFYLLG